MFFRKVQARGGSFADPDVSGSQEGYQPVEADGSAIVSSGPATRHFPITPDDDEDLPIVPRAIVFQTDGAAVLRDALGTDITYTRLAGDVLPLSPVRVLETGTTATLVGWA